MPASDNESQISSVSFHRHPLGPGLPEAIANRNAKGQTTVVFVCLPPCSGHPEVGGG